MKISFARPTPLYQPASRDASRQQAAADGPKVSVCRPGDGGPSRAAGPSLTLSSFYSLSMTPPKIQPPATGTATERSDSLTHLPMECVTIIAQFSTLAEIRVLERTLYGAQRAPQLYEHITTPFFALCGEAYDATKTPFLQLVDHGMPHHQLAQIQPEVCDRIVPMF